MSLRVFLTSTSHKSRVLSTAGNETVSFFSLTAPIEILLLLLFLSFVTTSTSFSSVFSDGQMMTMKGCVTRSFCIGDLSTKIGQSSIALDQSCCEGHLCNSAQSTPSRFFQLLGILYAILQMSL